MDETFKSEGKCLYCGKTFAKAGISRHLASHLADKTQTGKSGKSFFIKVETTNRRGNSPYFLRLWIDGEAKLQELDTFLRDIWLECCGHMSAFIDPNYKRGGWDIFDEPEDSEEGDISMKRKTKSLFFKGLRIDYEYDFGSTTGLTITVIDEYPVKADKKIVLLSRNEPLEIMCCKCKKAPATQICTECLFEEDAEFCDKCAKKHAKKCEAFEDYAALPVVNSPRMGECGYTGGCIDIERDGVFVMK